MSKKYGIELEFFVAKDEKIIPAYKATYNVDGDPFIGEIKTDIFDNIVDAVFNLRKKLFLEEESLKNRGFELKLLSEHKFSREDLVNFRKDKEGINRKELEVLEEFSIYPTGKLSKVLPKGMRTASLQINISNNKSVYYPEYSKITVEDKYKWIEKESEKIYSSLFNFSSIIFKLDKAFKEDIKNTKRVKGLYAIKEGQFGNRIEYRSLPNTVCFNKIIDTLKN